MTTEKAVSLRKAFEELERIVAAFEGGEIDLERDLPKFERGLALAQACRERLKELENHIWKVEKSFHVTDAATGGHDVGLDSGPWPRREGAP